MAEVQLPFRAEYAKSGRASCKGCRTPIEKASLRMAVMVQSPFFDGMSPNWFHFTCFFKKQKVKTVGDIAHYDSLRWDDQEAIKLNIAANAGANGPAAPAAKGKKRGAAAASGKAAAATVVKGPQDFGVEYAKSSRSTCRGCEEMIIKDVVRVSKKDFDSDEGRRFNGMDMWYHLPCFAKLRATLGWRDAGTQLPGYKKLTAEDKAEVKKQLPKVAPPPTVKAEASEEVDSGPPLKKAKSEATTATEAKLQEQNKAMFRYRDLLTGEGVKRPEMQEMLEYNDQYVPAGDERLRDVLSDCLVFGALSACSKCEGGRFTFRSGHGYVCQGDMTEWVKCNNTEVKPKRTKFIIPDNLQEKYSFLAKYKGKVGRREMDIKAPSASAVKVATKQDPDPQPLTYHPPPPLKNMQVLAVGDTKLDKDQLKAKVIALGGRWAKSLNPELAFVISNLDAVKDLDKRMQAVKDLDIQVLREDVLDEIKDFTPDDVFLYIKKKTISDWGSDPKTRVPAPEPAKSMMKSKTKSVYTKSVPSKMKVQLKGGAYVDPESGLEHMAHVYRSRDGDLYTAVLNLTDIQSNRNSFYKLQLLEADKGNSYWLFRQWGRIGTTIGGSLADKMAGLSAAKQRFHELYLEKSGNEWEDRKHFVKRPGLMYPVDVDYGEDAPLAKSLESELSCSLAPQVQDLIRMLFDVQAMQRTMMEFELDLEKMPLGKISSKQMRGGYAVLTQLQEAVVAQAPRATLLDLSNRFYTLVPHSFGVDTIPLIDSEEIIKQKLDMLESMMEIEIAYKLLSAPTSEKEHPLEAHYKQLKAHISVVDKQTEEFSLLQRYVRNTHAPTHTQYDLEIEEVFKVTRPEEQKRYMPYRKRLENKQLLWHGSRVTNFAGILSQGLRIAPKEAPVTGYMFGKGIYFADMVSKSANYCCTSKANPTGLMLLCEVALGKVCELTQAKALAKPPPGYHSVKGVGMTEPDPGVAHVTEEGVTVPLGPTRASQKQSSLLYNEYIVYETSQLQMQYLFKMRFHHKY